MEDYKGELVPDDVSKRDLFYEANARARKAGYPVTHSGKAEPRRIMTLCNFGATKLNIWPRDERGNLIE